MKKSSKLLYSVDSIAYSSKLLFIKDALVTKLLFIGDALVTKLRSVIVC